MRLVNETQEPDLVVEADASFQGWGAVCKGSQTSGPRSQTEQEHDLKLLAAMLVVKAFTKDRENIHVHLHMDNKTAIFYMNPMGETRFVMLNQLVVQLWQWCLQRNLLLSPEYLPGTDKWIGDKESRRTQSAEWKQNQEVF